MENIIKTEMNSDKMSLSDYVKILEISNYIDEWEQEALFSPSGFYSLKLKAVQGKTKEIIDTLNDDLDKIISDLVFDSLSAYKKAEEIRKNKIQTISEKMSEYENEEKLKWEEEVIDSAVENAKTKAIKYKEQPEIIEKCYLNGITSLGLRAELLNLNVKELDLLIFRFNSDFFEELVWSFIDDNSPFAFKFYSDNKNYISAEKQKTLEAALKSLGNKLSAFEGAKELFGKNYSKSQGEEQIAKIKDEEIRKYTKLYFEGFINSKENLVRQRKREINEKIWENIDRLLEENSDLALFEVDLNQSEKSILSEQNYIRTMIEKGKITTDSSKFFELYKEAFEKCEKFEALNLYDFKHCLNKNDFEFFSDLQGKISKDDFLNLKNEYSELKKYFVDDVSKNTEFIKTFNYEKKLFERNNKKQAEFVQIRELIERLSERYFDKSEKN